MEKWEEQLRNSYRSFETVDDYIYFIKKYFTETNGLDYLLNEHYALADENNVLKNNISFLVKVRLVSFLRWLEIKKRTEQQYYFNSGLKLEYTISQLYEQYKQESEERSKEVDIENIIRNETLQTLICAGFIPTNRIKEAKAWLSKTNQSKLKNHQG